MDKDTEPNPSMQGISVLKSRPTDRMRIVEVPDEESNKETLHP
jgi:hypothetical protein